MHFDTAFFMPDGNKCKRDAFKIFNHLFCIVLLNNVNLPLSTKMVFL